MRNDRSDTSVYKQLFMEIRDRYHVYIPVYTDEPRHGNYVVCAAFCSIGRCNFQEIA